MLGTTSAGIESTARGGSTRSIGHNDACCHGGTNPWSFQSPLSVAFVAWADSAGLAIQYIPKGEPNQNAYMERFNRPYRAEVLNLSLFRNLAEVREPTHWWRIDYKECRLMMPWGAYANRVQQPQCQKL